MPDDPRNAELETKATLPPSWRGENTDWANAGSMLLSGAAMMTRNRYLGWPALLLAVSSYLNQTPLRTKESSTGGGLSSIIFALGCLFATYLPMMFINPAVTKLQTPPAP